MEELHEMVRDVIGEYEKDMLDLPSEGDAPVSTAGSSLSVAPEAIPPDGHTPAEKVRDDEIDIEQESSLAQAFTRRTRSRVEKRASEAHNSEL